MTKAVPDPTPDPEPEPDDATEDKAWQRIAPRLKALHRETLDEWLNEIADAAPTDGTPAAGGSGNGNPPPAGGGGDGDAEPPATPRRARQAPKPSGGSIFDLLLGR